MLASPELAVNDSWGKNAARAAPARVPLDLRGLHGIADIVKDSPNAFSADQSQWHTVVRVSPVRLHILPAKPGPANYAEFYEGSKM